MSRIKQWLMAGLAALVLMVSAAQAHEEASVADLFESVSPSVVVIHTYRRSRSVETSDETLEIDWDSPDGLGSGTLVSPGGKVLTASHVVQVADAIRVVFADGTKVRARVIGSEPVADVALLQLEKVPKNAVIAVPGDSDKVRIGEQVFVIGAPYGEEHSLTVGYVSARRSKDDLNENALLGEFFQTDAAINKGNSGGPLFNMRGELIGVVSHIESSSGGSEGLGFAVTMRTVEEFLLKRRSFWSGLTGVTLGPKMSAALNVPGEGGYLIQQIADNSPAAQLQLHGGSIPAVVRGNKILLGGDVILSVQGVPVAQEGSYLEMKEVLSRLKLGDTLKLEILRAGKVIKISSVLSGGER